MADLSSNTSDIIRINEDSGQNLTRNSDFENAPSFTAATATTARWIDGTSGGSTTNDIYGWGLNATAAKFTAQFDSTTFNSGAQSLKLSLTGTGAICEAHPYTGGTPSAATTSHYLIPAYASTLYSASLYMKTNYTSGDSSDGAFLAIVERNSSGTATATRNSTKIKTTTNWTSYSFTFTTTSTTTYLDPRPSVYGSTGTATLIMDAWFDDIIIRSVVPSGNVVSAFNVTVTPGVQDISSPKIWS